MIYFNQSNPITPTFEAALKAQRVIDAAYCSSLTGKEVLIDTIN